MTVEFSLHEGFLIAVHSADDVRAYRSPDYYTYDTISYNASSKDALIKLIDATKDHGELHEHDRT